MDEKTQEMDYTALLEQEYGADPLIQELREKGRTDEYIYDFLKSFL